MLSSPTMHAAQESGLALRSRTTYAEIYCVYSSPLASGAARAGLDYIERLRDLHLSL